VEVEFEMNLFVHWFSFSAIQLSADKEQSQVASMSASCTQGLSNTANRRPNGHLLIAWHAVKVADMT
jgi:hypothetical protein